MAFRSTIGPLLIRDSRRDRIRAKSNKDQSITEEVEGEEVESDPLAVSIDQTGSSNNNSNNSKGDGGLPKENTYEDQYDNETDLTRQLDETRFRKRVFKPHLPKGRKKQERPEDVFTG